jgi:hypothetical protein
MDSGYRKFQGNNVACPVRAICHSPAETIPIFYHFGLYHDLFTLTTQMRVFYSAGALLLLSLQVLLNYAMDPGYRDQQNKCAFSVSTVRVLNNTPPLPREASDIMEFNSPRRRLCTTSAEN